MEQTALAAVAALLAAHLAAPDAAAAGTAPLPGHAALGMPGALAAAHLVAQPPP
jgi:hypothetical protein